jgi:glycosyltransferase involved in cell wall biosynthesis
MIHILLVVPHYSPNHPLLLEQIRLDPGRFRVVVCSLGPPLSAAVLADGPETDVRFVGQNARRPRWYDLLLLLRLKRVIEDEKVDIVNAHLARTLFPAVAAAHLARNRPRVISTIHGLGSARTLGRRLANQFLYEKVEKIIAVCCAVQQDLLGSNPGLAAQKVVVIPNGIDYDRFPAPMDQGQARARLPVANKDGFWFGTVGRLSRGKNVQSLIAAFRTVAAQQPNCTLVIAGSGPYEEELKALAESSGLGESVAFLGFRRDVPVVLRSCDAFVTTSLREGMPLALLEAMASSLPLIASKRGGIVELFGQARIGTLVDPEDIGAIASAMTATIDASQDKRDEIGRRARKRALKDFSARRMRAALEGLYAGVMAAPRNRPSTIG